MDTVFIYALKAPDTGEVRYVGKTKNPATRMRKHLTERSRNYRCCWIQSLLNNGQKPVMEVIDEIDVLESSPLECAYIEFFKNEGFSLVNATAGGEGVCGLPKSEAHKEKISEALLGHETSVETRLKIGAGNRGKKRTPETIANMRAARYAFLERTTNV